MITTWSDLAATPGQASVLGVACIISDIPVQLLDPKTLNACIKTIMLGQQLGQTCTDGCCVPDIVLPVV